MSHLRFRMNYFGLARVKSIQKLYIKIFIEKLTVKLYIYRVLHIYIYFQKGSWSLCMRNPFYGHTPGKFFKQPDDFGAMEAILEQAKQLEGAIKDLEHRKQQLQKDVKRLDEECELKRSQLEEHTQRYARLNDFVPAGDEILTLDVGGEVFRVYRSTLQQVEGSVLSTLASGRWQGSGGEDGTIFLDCNPRSFQEILDFLRELRLNRFARSSFTLKASRLADYLGIPVGRVLETSYLSAEFQRAGDTKVAPAFMFDVMMPGPFLCTLHAINFNMGRGGKVQIYVHHDSCLESQTLPENWKELYLKEQTVMVGRNRIDLQRGEAVVVGPHGVLGIYLSFSDGADDLLYSDKPSNSYYKVLSEQLALSEGMKLQCLKGRVAGSKPFSVGAHSDDRYFVGQIEYSLE